MEAAVRKEIKEIWRILRGVAERQASAEVRMDRADARMDRAEKRMHDFERLMQIGMTELQRAQRRTEATLEAFIASLRQGGNGHDRSGRSR